MFTAARKFKSFFARANAARRRAQALRQLETVDQQTLNDLGMSRATLVSMTFGKQAGQCAAY